MFQQGLCFIPPGRENTGIFTGPFTRSLSWILAFEINKSMNYVEIFFIFCLEIFFSKTWFFSIPSQLSLLILSLVRGLYSSSEKPIDAIFFGPPLPKTFLLHHFSWNFFRVYSSIHQRKSFERWREASEEIEKGDSMFLLYFTSGS